MTRVHKPMMKVLTTAVVGIIASSAAHAAGFSVYGEGNGINASNFGAGAAAEVHDASTAWYNPAGLALIHNKQAVAGGTAIIASGKLSGTSTYTAIDATGAPIVNPNNPHPESFSNIQGGKNAFIPSFAYAQPIGENATFGLSVVTPFGLATNWKNESAVRYAATNSELLTIDVSPSVGGKIHENVAIGLGLDIQYASVVFNSVLGDPVAGLSLPPALRTARYYDSTSNNEGNSVGLGFHAGILTMFNDNHTRIGLNYQSEVKHKFNGHSTLTGRLAGGPLASFRTDDLQSNSVSMPAITTLSGYHDVNDQWAVLGSVVYTQWDSLKNIVLTNVAGPGGLKLESTSVLNYKNAWRLAAGANYKMNDTFTLRFGGGFDETPTNNVDRDVRLPDADRWTLAIGGDYQVRPDMKVGFGWTHFFFDTSRLNKNQRTISVAGAAAIENTLATGKTNADLFGAQLVWDLDHVEPMKTK